VAGSRSRDRAGRERARFPLSVRLRLGRAGRVKDALVCGCGKLGGDGADELGRAAGAVGPTPTEPRLYWHGMALDGFLLFGVHRFTDRERGYGDEDPVVFHPGEFDGEQIVQGMWAAEMRRLVLAGSVTMVFVFSLGCSRSIR
jgi:hypothetical protein